MSITENNCVNFLPPFHFSGTILYGCTMSGKCVQAYSFVQISRSAAANRAKYVESSSGLITFVVMIFCATVQAIVLWPCLQTQCSLGVDRRKKTTQIVARRHRRVDEPAADVTYGAPKDRPASFISRTPIIVRLLDVSGL